MYAIKKENTDAVFLFLKVNNVGIDIFFAFNKFGNLEMHMRFFAECGQNIVEANNAAAMRRQWTLRSLLPLTELKPKHNIKY